MEHSLKQEQVKLLQVEKQVIGLGAGIATLTGAVAANASEVLGKDVDAHAAKITDAYLNLVQAMQAAHDALGEQAAAAGVKLMEARGMPKDPVLEAAKSALGLG